MRIDHFQRIENTFLEKFIERHSGNNFDEIAKHVGIEPILPCFARLVMQRLRGDALGHIRNRAFSRCEAIENSGLLVNFRDRLAPETIADARSVTQQIANGDLAFRRHGLAIGGQHFRFFEFGNEFRNRIVEQKFTFFVEHHHRDTRHRLSHRSNPENRIVGHRFFGIDIGRAEGFHVNGFVLARDGDDCAGELLVVDIRLQRRINARESRRRQADTIGRGLI